MGINKKHNYESLRTPFVGFSSKKEMGIESVLSSSGTIGMRLLTQPVEKNLACQLRDVR